MKIDLHVHSKFSTRPSQWVLQKLGCPESFTEPEKLYRIAKARGMDMVTISDHNTIDGALSIAHLPDTFLSVEITTYFPDDNCKIHVLAHDIDEATFDEIQRVRENIYDLVPYLRAAGVYHTCAHPLFAVNDRLTLEHFEQLLIMFKNLEMNGARDGQQNVVLRTIIDSLTEAEMEHLCNKHDLAADYHEPWVKNVTGGSDDHSAINIARMYTEVADAASKDEFFEGLLRGRSMALGEPSVPQTLSHNLYSIAYQFYTSKFKLDRYVNKDICLSFTDRFLGACEFRKQSGVIDKLHAYFTTRRYKKAHQKSYSKDDKKHKNPQDIMRMEAAHIICSDKVLNEYASGGKDLPAYPEHEWFNFANQASNRVASYFADRLFGNLSGGNVFDIFQTAGSAGALYAMLAPYFLSYSLFTKDRHFCDQVLARFDRPPRHAARNGQVKLGHFTDTLYEINGVAKTLLRSLRLAHKTGKDMTIITCDQQGDRGEQGVRNFAPIGRYDLPEYQELKLNYPPILEIINYCFAEDFTHLHSATPGPVGLTALLVSRILNLPIYGTYHTQLPQYVWNLTQDEAMEELTWRFMIWYYNQMDVVYAPSRSTADELVAKGIDAEKVRVYPRGVDVELFTPGRSNGFLKKYKVKKGFNLLYVGRVSREKNLEMLADVYKKLDKKFDVNLIIAGDGPYLEELKKKLKSTRAVFTGYVDGEELADLYASCDLFVFPSTTDTFGNVVLEAQASGVPVVVTDMGGPCENVLPGETGLVVRAGDADEFSDAIRSFIKNPDGAHAMGERARAYMQTRSFEQAFLNTWDMYKA